MTIYINKNSSNTVLLTLTERVSLSSPVFLFSLKSQASNREYNFIAADTSTATTRYNKFTIIETGSSQSLTQGKVSLNEEGWYNYKIYEQSSSSNLAVSATTSLLETGLAYISGATRSATFVQDNNFKVYY